MPAFVYFDVDDTLLDHQAAERDALADVRTHYLETFGHLSVDELQDTYHRINTPLWTKYSAGEIEKATVQQQRFVRLLDAVDAPHVNAGLVGRYYMKRYAEHWRFIPGAREAFEAVADRYPVGVLTNGFAEVQAQKFKRFPVLRETSKAVVVSEETGAMKPDPSVFQHAADAAGVDASGILYVGDSYRSDVRGGTNAGWRVAWYRRNGAAAPEDATATPDLTFTDWSALLDYLDVG